MPRRADTPLFTRLATLSSDMATLEADLLKHGDQELASVVKRARRELQHPAFTGANNTRGVDSGAVRH